MAATYQPLAASGLAAILRIPRIKLRQKETAIMQQGISSEGEMKSRRTLHRLAATSQPKRPCK